MPCHLIPTVGNRLRGGCCHAFPQPPFLSSAKQQAVKNTFSSPIPSRDSYRTGSSSQIRVRALVTSVLFLLAWGIGRWFGACDVVCSVLLCCGWMDGRLGGRGWEVWIGRLGYRGVCECGREEYGCVCMYSGYRIFGILSRVYVVCMCASITTSAASPRAVSRLRSALLPLLPLPNPRHPPPPSPPPPPQPSPPF